MATITYKGLSGIRNTVTVNTTDTLTVITNAIKADEGLNSTYYANFVLYRNNSISLLNNPSGTYSGLGLTSSDMLIAILNDNPATFNKEQRQVQKLEIAAVKRTTDNRRPVYDITQLPTQYNNNAIVDNPNVGGLIEGRPWLPTVVTSGLTMRLDANDPASYPGSGNTWIDLSGVGANQTLVNSPTYVSGTPSYFSFNGVNQYSTGSQLFVIPPNMYTKIVWFQFNTLAADNNLVSSSAGGHFIYGSNSSILWAGNADNPPFSGPGAFRSTGSLSANTWYCAAVVFSAPQIRMYINGVLSSIDITYGDGTGHDGDGSVNLACFAPGGNLLNGKIAEVYCYSRNLSADEVLQVFNATKSKYGF